MVFASPIFLFLFLPAFFAAYFLFPRRWRNLVIIAASLFFYTWGEAKLVLVMLVSTFVDYICALVMANDGRGRWWQSPPLLTAGRPRTKRQRTALIISLAVNLGFLLFFKYAGWGLENLQALGQALNLSGEWMTASLQVALPLGISFYTFQSMSYSIDVFRGHAQATRNLFNYATLITKFPLLIAGPIIRYADIAKQLVSRVITVEKFAYGVRRFVVGLGKKVLIANTLAVPADAVFALPADELTTGAAWLGIIAYALQIFFDFSGYSDMAIGLGHMLGFTFLENFNYPYIAQSVREFWRRWHISLSTWFRDYLYIPLGGNRHGDWRTAINLLFVFFVTGLWHGASWTFVVWGLWHGLFLLLERVKQGSWLAAIGRPGRHIYAMLVVVLGWVFFRADSLSQAGQMFQALAGFGAAIPEQGVLFLNGKVGLALILGLIASAPLWQRRPATPTPEAAATIGQSAGPRWRLATILGLAAVFILSVMQLASGTYNPFIYFRF